METSAFIRKLLLDRKLVVNVDYKANGLHYVTAFDPQTSSTKTLNEEIIEAGFAMVDERAKKRSGDLITKLIEVEEQARKVTLY